MISKPNIDIVFFVLVLHVFTYYRILMEASSNSAVYPLPRDEIVNLHAHLDHFRR
jgi:hypothetical protein